MERHGLSGSTLKIIAIVSMLIDHVAATVVAGLIRSGGADSGIGWLDDPAALYEVYTWMRNIGRLAFPIFCFLLVEGFLHTKNKARYALRLGVFAIVSEIPFDLAFQGRFLETGYQNVFFTLLLGLLVILIYHKLEEQRQWNRFLCLLFEIAVILAGMGAAELLRTDYGAYGILAVAALYLFRGNKGMQTLAGCAAFIWWEPSAAAAFIPIWFYNGTRGWNLKYIFYLFYPVHLLLLYLLCVWMGIAVLPV